MPSRSFSSSALRLASAGCALVTCLHGCAEDDHAHTALDSSVNPSGKPDAALDSASDQEHDASASYDAEADTCGKECDPADAGGTDGSADAGTDDGGASDASFPDAEPADAATDDGGHADSGVSKAGGPVRLLIADAKEAKLRVVDPDSEAVLATFDVASVARVYRGPSGAFGYAVQGGADNVNVVHSGLYGELHDDHYDYTKETPTLLEYTLPGDNPIHFTPHDDWAAVFFDDLGVTKLLHEPSLLGTPKVVSIDSGAPHHGIALAFHGHVLVTRPTLLPNQTRATPTGISVYESDGTPTGQVFDGCTSVHGEAARGHEVAFGCKEGVLVLKHGSSGFSGKLVPNPTSSLEPAPRVGTLSAHERWPFFIGNFGTDQLARVDVAASTLTPHKLEVRVQQFGFDSSGRYLMVLAVDGTMRLYDPSTFEEGPSFNVTSAVGTDTAMAPQYAVSELLAYVTDPQAGTVHVVDVENQEVLKSIVVPGAPAKIAVLSAQYEAH